MYNTLPKHVGKASSKQIITGCGPSTTAANKWVESEMRRVRKNDAGSGALQCRGACTP